MFFEIDEENIFQRKEFNLYQSLEELIKIDKYFRQFDNLEEVFNSIKILIMNKNLTIIKEDKLMKIKINNPNLNKEFFINIPLKEKDLKSEIDSIVHYVISLNDKINDLEKQIKENKIEFENKIKIIEKNKEEINLIKNEFILFKKNLLEFEKKKCLKIVILFNLMKLI